MQNGFYRFIVVALFSLFPFFSQAEPLNLTALEARYQGFKSWSVDFTQTSHIETLNQDLNKTGRISAIRPRLLRIDYTTEPQKSYIYNGEKLWIYQPLTEEAQEFPEANRVLTSEALSFLGGLDKISSLFDAVEELKEAEGTLKISDKNLQKIALLPKNENTGILRLTLGIEPSTSLLKEAVLFNTSGNVTHYQFDTIQTDINLDQKTFALPAQAKVKVVKP